VHVTNSTFVGNDSVLGGAIRSIDLTLIDSTVTGNTAFTGGGGVQAGGSVTIVNSTISGNEAGDFGNGGGVYSLGTDMLIVNSTITGNHADGESGQGGGVFASGEVTVVYSDIVGNSAPTAANIGGFAQESSITSFGTVVGNPLGGGANCENIDASSDGYNFEQGGSTCGFGAGPGDVTDGPDPQLGGLAANGGPTETLLPATTSPLVDAIPVAACSAGLATGITTDQRGVTRPQGDGCDIGSVEVGEAAPADELVEVTPRLTG
jgi:predicted outer membrane repeat protein